MCKFTKMQIKIDVFYEYYHNFVISQPNLMFLIKLKLKFVEKNIYWATICSYYQL